MNLNDLLLGKQIDPKDVLVLRHRPREAQLLRAFPLICAERTDLFETYQRAQGDKLEKTMAGMVGRGHLASFISHGAGRALFIGLYKIDAAKPVTFDEFLAIPRNVELRSLGMESNRTRPLILWFDLRAEDFYPAWKGKLIVGWPPPDRTWYRRAHKNVVPVRAILEDSALDGAMPEWNSLDLTWAQLRVLPTKWRNRLSEWRAIYYIFDESDRKGYVGSAYGAENLLQRWLSYAATGHGGNRLLRMRDPANFHFSILERVSPDMDPESVIALETTWKKRLHTRSPGGLNDN
ncbi:MAG TPA: GIY-YIG nuclease family protein [Rhizomicrobium sp.]|jgi:hypothetical protein